MYLDSQISQLTGLLEDDTTRDLPVFAVRRASFSALSLFQHFSYFLKWLELDPASDSWQRWHNSNQRVLRNFSFLKRLAFYCIRVLPGRLILIVSSMAAFEVSELPPTSLPYHREQLSLVLGMWALLSALLLYFIGDSGSTRHICKVLGQVPIGSNW